MKGNLAKSAASGKNGSPLISRECRVLIFRRAIENEFDKNENLNNKAVICLKEEYLDDRVAVIDQNWERPIIVVFTDATRIV